MKSTVWEITALTYLYYSVYSTKEKVHGLKITHFPIDHHTHTLSKHFTLKLKCDQVLLVNVDY